jgi:antitoxin HicB
MAEKLLYDVIVRPLTKEEGEGYLAFFPDIPGCFADGATPEEAIHEAEDALQSWMQTAREFNDPIPSPKQKYSGQWRVRVPKSLHADLAIRAKYEGVSLNTLVSTILSGAMGHPYESHKKT